MKGKEYLILGGVGLAAYFLFLRPKTSTTNDNPAPGGGGSGGYNPFPNILFPGVGNYVPQIDYSSIFAALQSALAPKPQQAISTPQPYYSPTILGSFTPTLPGVAQYGTQVVQGTAAALALPKSSGNYNPTTFVYTSPQGYKMSVAPENVSKVANTFNPNTVSLGVIKASGAVNLSDYIKQQTKLGKIPVYK